MDKTRTVGQKKLVIRDILFFWSLKMCSKAQYILIVLPQIILVADVCKDNDNRNNDNRQTPRKPCFFWLKGSQNMEIQSNPWKTIFM